MPKSPRHLLTVTLLLGLGAVGLSGCYVMPPYAVPAHVPTYPPPPAHATPPTPLPGPPRPGGPPTASPPPGGSPGSAQTCQTVTVEGHWETRVRPNGQRETVWVPTHVQQICQ